MQQIKCINLGGGVLSSLYLCEGSDCAVQIAMGVAGRGDSQWQVERAGGLGEGRAGSVERKGL